MANQDYKRLNKCVYECQYTGWIDDMRILLTLINSCITSINDSCDDTFVSVHTYSGSRTGLLRTMRWSRPRAYGHGGRLYLWYGFNLR